MNKNTIFNVITAFVNAQLISISKFFSARMLEQFWLFLQPICHMLNKLIYLNSDLNKRAIHHILMIWQLAPSDCHLF